MSDEESAAEKEHDPSQKRLDDAREKGEIARSADLSTAASYAGLLLAAVAFGPNALQGAGEAAAVLLGQADHLSVIFLSGGTAPLAGVLVTFAATLAPFFLLPALAVVLVVLAQRAMIFTPSKLAPKLNRISILSGIKNKFGRKGLFEFAKSFVKLVLISILLGSFLMLRAPKIMATLYLSPALATIVLLEQVVGFLLLIVLIAAVIGGVDYFWQRAEHIRSNRMSRKEMMDEHKNSEGDPHMKAKRRQKGY
ncbi:MAG: EscU/YscU/HrcU family type III secretion system export apparatus switch protein, partial [Paracoccaceae bacterium]|nr:EscU/YscU/HrcU family type III secretion system export apparatus switch protein [Paracoccaceae bacterium]